MTSRADGPEEKSPFEITETFAWLKLERALQEARFPQAIGLKMPMVFFETFARTLGKVLLCRQADKDEPCVSCQAWASGEHPDLLVSGKTDEAPTVDRCRSLWGELSLKPVLARRRMAVIYNADRLSPGAANSMLKMTEEPPADSLILFLHETGDILPTLRSRMWNLVISSQEIATAIPPPTTPAAWKSWLNRTVKASPQEMDLELQGMITSLLEQGCPKLAEDLETLRVYARKGNLSTAMLQDSLFLLLKEEKPIEQLFADFW